MVGDRITVHAAGVGNLDVVAGHGLALDHHEISALAADAVDGLVDFLVTDLGRGRLGLDALVIRQVKLRVHIDSHVDGQFLPGNHITRLGELHGRVDLHLLGADHLLVGGAHQSVLQLILDLLAEQAAHTRLRGLARTEAGHLGLLEEILEDARLFLRDLFAGNRHDDVLAGFIDVVDGQVHGLYLDDD